MLFQFRFDPVSIRPAFSGFAAQFITPYVFTNWQSNILFCPAFARHYSTLPQGRVIAHFFYLNIPPFLATEKVAPVCLTRIVRSADPDASCALKIAAFRAPSWRGKAGFRASWYFSRVCR